MTNLKGVPEERPKVQLMPNHALEVPLCPQANTSLMPASVSNAPGYIRLESGLVLLRKSPVGRSEAHLVQACLQPDLLRAAMAGQAQSKG